MTLAADALQIGDQRVAMFVALPEAHPPDASSRGNRAILSHSFQKRPVPVREKRWPLPGL